MLRKFKSGGVILGALLALAGCQSEKLVDDSGSQGSQVTLTASRGIGSRTHLGDPVNNSVPMYWTEGDQIYVSSKDGKTTGVLTLSSQAGEASGTFTGFVFGDPKDLYYSVYPVPKDGKLDLSSINGLEIKTPMLGYIAKDDTGTDVAFSNTCGMAKVKLANAKGNLKFYAGKSDNGTIKDQLTLSSVATINVSGDEVSLKYNTTGKAANILVNNAQPIEGFLYIPYDLQSNKNASEVHFFIQGEEGELKQVSEEPVDLSQVDYGQVVQAVKEDLYTSGGEIVEATEKAVQNGELTLEQTENVVKTTVTQNTVVKMPVTIENDEAVVVFEEISENATITIQSQNAQNESDIENASQISEMTVILPSGTTEAEATETLKVNMPNTSVTVQSEDGNVLNINNVVALTGDNTFIIKEGVVIESLVAMKGAIEVSGIVNAISRGEGHHYGNNKVKVKVKKGGKIPSDINKDEFDVEYEGDDVPSDNTPDYTQSFDGTVKTFSELQEALKYNGGLVRIGSDFAIEAPLTITGDFELKMQYRTLSVAEGLSGNVKGLITNKGNLSISIGTFEGPSTCPIKYFFWNEAGSSFHLRGVNIRTNGIYGGVLIENGTCEIENFDENTTSSIISSNLAVNNSGTITIEGAEIEGDFINNNQGIITIQGGSVKGDLENSPQGTIAIEGVEPNGKGWPTSGSIEEEDPFDGPIVTIQNVSLSQALLKSLDNGIIRINETTKFAEIPQSVVGEIDYLELKGMSEAFTLSGLEVFTSLERLVVIQNTFTSFSVSGLPSTIKHFSIAENNALANLTFDANSTVENLVIAVNPVLKKLDVTNITNIVELVVTENATLNEIELPEDNQIKALVANRNALSTIDLSGCGDSLMELGLEENQLTTLEVKNFKNLKHIGYNGNPLTEVNFSGCSSLMDFHMENNPMTRVNLSGCTSLSRIYCNSGEQNGSLEVLNLSGCSGLEELYCSGHHLKELDLRSAAKLEHIQCGKQIDDQGQSITIKLMLHPNLSAKWNERWGSDEFNLPSEIVTTGVDQGQGSNGGANFPIEGIY